MVDFYDKNAFNFSKTRVNPWPSTIQFLNNIEKNSKVLDVGCGNGRNLFYRDDINVTGLEYSKELCKIVENKGGKVVNANMTDMPFDNNYFDYIICIASYHHLDNDKDREKAINEMFRVLKEKGKVFIQVWAMEQPFNSKRKFLKRNQIVPWKNKDGTILNRYYRIYPKGELEIEVKKFNSDFELLKSFYEEGNWVIILLK